MNIHFDIPALSSLIHSFGCESQIQITQHHKEQIGTLIYISTFKKKKFFFLVGYVWYLVVV